MDKIERWVPGIAVSATVDGIDGVWMIRRVVGQNITLANIENQSVLIKKREDLEELLNSEKLNFLADDRHNGEVVFRDLPEADQIETSRKYAYVRAYFDSEVQKRSRRQLEKIIRPISESINDNAPPAWNTLNNWLKQYVDAGNRIQGLFPRDNKKGCRKLRMDPRVQEIIDLTIKLYFKNGKIRKSSIHRIVESKVIKHNLNNPYDLLRIPAYSTVVYHIRRRSYQEYIKGRVGKNAHRYKFSKVGEAPVTSRILERVEADHAPLDIHVLHDETKTLLGRPTLTVLIDHYSSMVTGYQISFEEPSYASAAMSIVNAILPKKEVLEFHEIDGVWPAQGVMELMVTDNGTEFWSRNIDMAVSEIGSVIQYSPVRSPNYKGVVERFFLTVKTMLIDSLPGKTNGVGKGSNEYVAQNEAKLTLSEFKKIFLNWLVNIYHLEAHGDSEESPFDIWNKSATEFPVAEEDAKRIETAFMCTEKRKLDRSGIQYENLEYNSNALRDIFRRDGCVSLTIKYSPFDMGHIYVWDELNRVYIGVRSVNYRYAKGLSLYAHKAIRQRINASKKNYKDNAVLQRAKAELFGEIELLHEKNVRRKSQKTSKRAARISLLGIDDLTPRADLEDSSLVIDNMRDQDAAEDWEVW